MKVFRTIRRKDIKKNRFTGPFIQQVVTEPNSVSSLCYIYLTQWQTKQKNSHFFMELVVRR